MYYNYKTALVKISEGQQVKMSSGDFRKHIFYLNPKAGNKGQKELIHAIKSNRMVIPKEHQMTYDDFIEKYKGNDFLDYID